MSIYTTVNVTRKEQPVLSNVPVQIDETSEMMGAYYNNEHPYDVFEVFVRYTTFQFVRGDLLTDTRIIDPLTSVNAKYRVVGNPTAFPDGHVQMKVNVFAGPNS
jgi:hypothetical protein